MARARSTGNGKLEEALTNMLQSQAALMQNQTALMQNQAAFLARVAETDTRIAETNARIAETNARIAEMDRINSERFGRIEALLREYNRILAALPDAIREKIGFKPPSS
jgi:uncharacterized protein involved in exopolysaccharide biosynthesis